MKRMLLCLSMVFVLAASQAYSDSPRVNDFDGSGSSDYAVYQPSTGYWFVQTHGGRCLEWYRQWGYANALPVPADYNGDGITDIAVYDKNGGYWYILTREEEVLAWGVQWGWNTAVPVPGDYDGDGKADLGVYDLETGNWYVASLENGGIQAEGVLYWAQNWGFKGDVRKWEKKPYPSTVLPMPFDYDRDGKTDLAVYYRGLDMPTSVWYIQGSHGPYWFGTAWGSSTSLGAPGRYAEFVDALWPMGVSSAKIAAKGYPAEWNTPYVPGNTAGHGIFIGEYGRTLPVPGLDFDGNGWDDYAVYDYLNGNWKVLLSTGDGNTIKDQTPVTLNWGFSGAIPATVYSTIYRACNYTVEPW